MGKKLEGAAVGGLVGLGILGILLVFAIFFMLGALFWGWIIMLCVGALKPAWGWGYWDAVFPWGVIAGFVTGILSRSN